jgi:hypothetical protein
MSTLNALGDDGRVRRLLIDARLDGPSRVPCIDVWGMM